MNAQLNAREIRKQQIESFFELYPTSSLIVIKANMPSFLINKPINYYLIKIFLDIIMQHFEVAKVIYYKSEDGPYFFVQLNNQDTDIKKYLINIEESHSLGRLIDLDYFINSYKSISRVDLKHPLRKCFICEKDAFICIRENNHTKEEISEFIHNNFISFIKEKVAELSFYSLIRELELEDKFGLVTKTTSGNHQDMDYNIMLKAIEVIAPHQSLFVEMGYNATDLKTLLKKARPLGIEVEKKMFAATSGINAYKGAIFLLSSISLALGYTLKNQYSFNDLFENIKIINENIYDDFNIYSDTFTSLLYKEKQISGIRGVVKDGLEIVKNNLNKISPHSTDDEIRKLLYYYILNSDDTIFIKRSLSYNNYLTHKNYLKQLDPNNKKELKIINDYCKEYNLSFGGSADLLISSIYLTHLKSFYI